MDYIAELVPNNGHVELFVLEEVETEDGKTVMAKKSIGIFGVAELESEVAAIKERLESVKDKLKAVKEALE